MTASVPIASLCVAVPSLRWANGDPNSRPDRYQLFMVALISKTPSLNSLEGIPAVHAVQSLLIILEIKDVGNHTLDVDYSRLEVLYSSRHAECL